MSSPQTPARPQGSNSISSANSPARTPRGRLIFGNNEGDSPLPPLVEVAPDETPTRVTLVSQEASVEASNAEDEDIESIPSDEETDLLDIVGGQDHNDEHMDVDENSSSGQDSDGSDHESGSYYREYDEEGENENEDEDEDEDEDNDDDDDDEDGDTDHQGSDEDNSDGEDDDGEDHDSLNALADMLRNRQGNNHSLFGFDIGGIARMSGASQFRPLVATLKKYDDQTQQLVALQELTELLSISTEESLIGLNIGELCQVLVNLLKGAGGDYGELTGFIPGNPDIMLLACRCLSNLLEALPLAGAVLVRFGTIEVLCGKLLEIEFIDLAEQALSTLEHLSREFPTKVCDAGGMSACLMFLDFFATSTQRTALACAANCARGVTNEHFSQAKDTVQILERTVGYSDQKIVESSCSALLHLINAFRSESEKVEQLVSADLVKSIVQCIHPDNPAASSTPVTVLLHILVAIVHSSRERTAQILDMDAIPALEQILVLKCTGTAAASGDPKQAGTSPAPAPAPAQHNNGSVMRVPEQAWEALRLLVALLPRLPSSPGALSRAESIISRGTESAINVNDVSNADDTDDADKDQILRLQQIESRPKVIQQLQRSLVRTMIDIFLSTMNTAARYRSLLVMLKIIFYLSTDQLRLALQNIKLSTFVAQTISVPDSPLLSGISLLLVRIILAKLPDVYEQKFIREGVANELAELASHARMALEQSKDSDHSESSSDSEGAMDTDSSDEKGGEDETNPVPTTCLAYGFKLVNIHIPSSLRTNPAGSARQFALLTGGANCTISKDMKALLQWVCSQAQALHDSLHSIESSSLSSSDASVLGKLRRISQQLADSSATDTSINELLECLGSPDSITCYELMQSGLIDALLGALDSAENREARSHLVSRFLLPIRDHGDANAQPESPFSILMSRLQEALDITENVQLQEAYQSPSDEIRTPANMLTKQIRFKVAPADAKSIEDSQAAKEVVQTMERVRQSFQLITVSVHAIATFGVLEAYLRPRIALSIGKKHLRRQKNDSRQKPASSSAAAHDAAGGDGSSAALRPQQAQLERQPAAADETSQAGRSRRDRPDEAQRQHIRMLQMIAQSSGIDLRAAGLLEGLDSDMSEDDNESMDERTSENCKGDANADGTTGTVASDGAAASPNTKRTDDWRLVFNLECGGISEAVPLDENIFRAINKLRQRSEALRNSNMWTQVFTLRFHVEFGKSPTPSAAQRSEGANSSPSNEHAKYMDKLLLASNIGGQSAVIVQLIRSLHELLPLASEACRKELQAPAATMPGDNARPELFVNRKISAKVARQLDEPLIVVCSAIPQWCHQVVHFAPFLIPLDTRLAYLQATSFGYSRNIAHWQNIAQREARSGNRTASDVQIPLGRIQRQKVRISRHRVLESALKVLELYGSAKTVLEVEYFDEVGTGLGPTLEFYATVSRNLQEKQLGLWRDEGAAAAKPGSPEQPEYVEAPRGLFPCAIDPAAVSTTVKGAGKLPVSGNSTSADASSTTLPPADRAVQLFKFAGHLIAKGLIDGRILDLPLHEEFWAAVQRQARNGSQTQQQADDSRPSWTWSQLERVDPSLAKSLKYLQRFVDAKCEIYAREDLSADQKLERIEAIRDPSNGTSVEDLSLDFTLPGHPDIELRADGSAIPVTINNAHTYVDLVAKWTLDIGIRSQISAFCEGFDAIFPISDLSIFTPAELSRLAGPSSESEDWSMQMLLSSIKADHGFSMSSPAVQMFLSFMTSLSNEERRKFLQFVTGSPRLPFGGFRALHPPLTLVHKICEPPLVSDDYLPSVMTCANYIKLPNYSSLEILVERWNHAVTEGQQSFHLS